jgi:hypothetical protein
MKVISNKKKYERGKSSNKKKNDTKNKFIGQQVCLNQRALVNEQSTKTINGKTGTFVHIIRHRHKREDFFKFKKLNNKIFSSPTYPKLQLSMESLM